MVNAGAIAATSLVAGHSAEDRLGRLLGVLSLYAGRPLALDRAVYESERETGHRNRAIGHMLRSFEILSEDPEPALDLYFKQCSVAVDTRDLAVMGATLANGGMNPLTGERALRADLVPAVLSVMTSCGMYDYAGEWLYWVGMPAKSGVAGGIVAVLPGQLGIGVFSPRLDARGNSVRGVAVCKDLSANLHLHSLRVPRAARSTLSASYDLTGVRSRRLRPEAERDLLDSAGQCVRVYQLNGDVSFAGIESVTRCIVEASDTLSGAILDLTQVSQISEVAARVVVSLAIGLLERGQWLVLVGAQRHSRFLRIIEEGLGAEQRPMLRTFAHLDPALELCEDRLIAEHKLPDPVLEPIPLAQHELCRGLEPGAVGWLETRLEKLSFERGQAIVRRGGPADRLFLLIAGRVSVTVDLADGSPRRLSTLSAGMTFGELAFIQRATRSADVCADTPVQCLSLSLEEFDRLDRTRPEVKTGLLENLLRNAADTVTRLTREIASLGR
jgi:glutaminase